MLYHEKYRIPSIRLQNWDYRSAGYYFVTISTRNRWTEPFGHIQNQAMSLSDIGKIAEKQLCLTPQVRSYVQLDEWIIMPDHLHAIIVIKNQPEVDNDPVETSRRDVSTSKCLLLPKSLGSIINQFKSVCTKEIWRLGYSSFQWQPRYYERIIRSDRELHETRLYIRDNPKNW